MKVLVRTIRMLIVMISVSKREIEIRVMMVTITTVRGILIPNNNNISVSNKIDGKCRDSINSHAPQS